MLRHLCLLVAICAGPALADARLCNAAADTAAARHGVPPALMRAITRVETGRDGRPWPWTLNVDGRGQWFASPDEAFRAAQAASDAGSGQIDLGCFQLNLQWHGNAFPGIEAMLDPMANADYAARFLADLHAEFGDWRSAAAAYHSRTGERGDAYIAKLEAAHAEGGDEIEVPEAPLVVAERQNRFPLLAGGQGSGGSLVPRVPGISPLIGGP